jgi:quercetin dioxygenase-like cupin family protein
MIRVPVEFRRVAVASLLTTLPLCVSAEQRAAAPRANGHQHLGEVACVDVPPGKKRPEFGCFNVGTVRGLHFQQTVAYWHLHAFASRQAAEAVKSPTGIVVEEDGRVWLSEFGAQDAAPRGGEVVAVVGPLQLAPAKSYSAVLSYAVMRPGDSSRVHTHPGPEGWYVLAGTQCLETPAGASSAGAGQSMTAPPNVPMELYVTGAALRRAFALVIHDSTQHRGTPSDWKPPGKCGQ